MKLLLTMFLACTLAIALHAQKFDVSISPERKFQQKGSIVRVGNGYIGLQLVDNKMQLAFTLKISKLKFGIKLLVYDSTMTLIKENILANGERAFGPLEPSLHLIDGKPYLVYYQYHDATDDGTMKLMLAGIDPITLNLLQERECLSIDQKNTGLFKSLSMVDNNFFTISESPDGNKKLFFWASNTTNQYFHSSVSKDLVFGKSIGAVVNNSAKPNFQSACIDNLGNIYAGYKTEVAKKEFQGRVLVCPLNGKTRDMEVRLPEGHAYEIQVFVSKKDNIAKACGTYTTDDEILQGVYLSAVGLATTAMKPVTTPFSNELLKQLDNDGWANKKKGIAKLKLDVVELVDGTIDMIGEFRRTDFPEHGGGAFRYSGSVVNVMMKDKNVVFCRIPKARTSAGSTIGDSFSAFPFGDKMIVLYDDHDKNLERDLSKSPTGSNVYKNSVLVAGTISSDGSLKREKIIDLQDDNYLAVTEDMIVLSPSSFMMPLRKIGGTGAVKDEFKWATVGVR